MAVTSLPRFDQLTTSRCWLHRLYRSPLTLSARRLFLNCEIGHRCRLKSAESLLTTFLLSDRKAEWALDWDSEDEESLEVQRERVLLLTMGGVCLEALLALLWAVCNCAFPPSGDADVWLRCLWLLAFRSTLPGLFCLRWANAWRWK